MKKLQPEMEKLKQRFADDQVRQQQEMMELYKREKINPVSGCLPMLLQIPVFFSLYKVLFVTIEMRQAPFFGWIHDLSAPDPTSIINLFGLLPFHPPAFIPAFLSIGIWPMLMGCTQWLQTKMNPAPADPVQARMFAFMPLIFTFMLATFPAGLVIYWTWNNLLSVTQQYVIMRRQGVKVHLFENLKPPAFLQAADGGRVNTRKGSTRARLFSRAVRIRVRCDRSRCRRAILPEVAFVGRSNVGKSSLINALTNRKTLARVSQTPGRTRQINFFKLGGALMLVDLPGYGFAQVSKALAEQWQQLIFAYLNGRRALRRVILLIDARRGVMPHRWAGDGAARPGGGLLRGRANQDRQAQAGRTRRGAKKCGARARRIRSPTPRFSAHRRRPADGLEDLRVHIAALAAR